MTIKPPMQREAPGLTTAGGARPRRAPTLRALALVAVLIGSPGCGEEELPSGTTRQAVAIDEVPENVRSAASKAIPGVKFEDAWKNIERGGKLHSYEIRGRNPANGKTREVRVSPT